MVRVMPHSKVHVDTRDVCFRLESTYSITDIDARMRIGRGLPGLHDCKCKCPYGLFVAAISNLILAIIVLVRNRTGA